MMEREQPWHWAVLGLDAGSDERTVKRAYARQLKSTRPDADPDAFQRLRAAYEHALDELRYRTAAPELVPEPEPVPGAAAPDAAPAPGTVMLDKVDVAPPAPVMLPVQRDAAAMPDALAQAAWDDLLATWELAPEASIAAARADARLQGFDARDAYELLAMRHAAGDACPPALRAALADLFDWTGRGVAVLRQHPDCAAELLSRHAADVGWDNLVQQAATDPMLRYLAQDTVPARLPQRWNRRFVHAMRDTLRTIRWQHGDLLAHRMNHDVFTWWETQVADKKYFRQTAGWSSVAGVGLWALLVTATTLADDWPGFGIVFIACQVLALAGGAWLALRPPATLFAHAHALQVRWFGKPLLDARFDRAWQVGWMGPFALLSLALLLPDPHPVVAGAIVLGMTVCTAMALLACSVAITRARFCVAFVLSIAAIICASAIPAFAPIPEWSTQCFGLVLFTVFLSHGMPLYSNLGWTSTLLARLRAGWLAAGVGLAIAISQDAFPMLQLPALMLLLLSGVFIARYNAGLRLVWIGLVGARAFANMLQQSHGDAHFALALLSVATAYFVAAHLFNQADE